jgi:2-C-methyl-D-erythritol 2,4-cyclodiphosphate synthase
MRIGFGFDVHQLAADRPLFLGGVLIPSTFGAVGHSDADVLLHAICDAMLGALALGDIGLHFPDTDASFKNIDSKILLQKTYNLISEKKYEVVNIDSCVVLESPKILKYAPEMQIAISKILKIEPSDVSIKATTNEKLGYIGRGEGIVAHAVVLLQKK